MYQSFLGGAVTTHRAELAIYTYTVPVQKSQASGRSFRVMEVLICQAFVISQSFYLTCLSIPSSCLLHLFQLPCPSVPPSCPVCPLSAVVLSVRSSQLSGPVGLSARLRRLASSAVH